MPDNSCQGHHDMQPIMVWEELFGDDNRHQPFMQIEKQHKQGRLAAGDAADIGCASSATAKLPDVLAGQLLNHQVAGGDGAYQVTNDCSRQVENDYVEYKH